MRARPASTWVVVACAFLLRLGWPGFAHAEELPQPADAKARAHLEAGNKAFDEARSATDTTAKQEKFRAAIREYMAGLAAETKFHYAFYWNLGHAHRQLGEYTRARFFYGKFLEFAPARFSEHRTAAEDFQRMMQAELDKAATTEKAAALQSADSTVSTTTAQPASQPNGASALRPLPGGPEDGRPRWYSDRVGWAVFGAGLTASAVGGGLLINSSSLFDQADDEDRQSVKADLEDRARSRRTIGFISGGVGLACLVGGVIKLAMPESPRSVPASLSVTVGPSSFSIQGSF